MEVDASEFEIGEIVSQGGFSIVHRAMLRGTEVLCDIYNMKGGIEEDLQPQHNSRVDGRNRK
jgi:precorrin isomerase